jgi:hypothetical protein
LARRAREEGWGEPSEAGGEATPGEHERATLLIDRCDYFANAARVVREAARAESDRVYADNFLARNLLSFLEAEREAAKDELRRYKREIGLLDI